MLAMHAGIIPSDSDFIPYGGAVSRCVPAAIQVWSEGARSERGVGHHARLSMTIIGPVHAVARAADRPLTSAAVCLCSPTLAFV